MCRKLYCSTFRNSCNETNSTNRKYFFKNVNFIFISKSYILSQSEFSYIIKPKVIFTIHKSLLVLPTSNTLL